MGGANHMKDFDNLYDLIIVGGGPAGLSAAIYAARAKERVLVIEENEFGGLIALTDKVMNYPGMEICSGRELSDIMEKQAKSFGAELIYDKILSMNLNSKMKEIQTKKQEYRALAVILATGSKPRNVGFEGEKRFRGNGVSNCAICDGPLFAGCPVYVIGGGPAAVEEAIYLAGFSEKITLVIREEKFTCDQRISDQLKDYPSVRVLFQTEIKAVKGEDLIHSVQLLDRARNHVWEETSEDLPIGVFVFVGYEPNTACLPKSLEKDAQGYLITDCNCKTTIEGVSAAGDVRRKSLRQVVTATSDGALAAVGLEAYIKLMHQELSIPNLLHDEKETFQIQEKGILKLWLDDSKLSKEMMAFIQEKEELKEYVTFEEHREEREGLLLPSIEICRADGCSSGIHFHAVPEGVEWNSFCMALFNVLGCGQKIDPQSKNRILQLKGRCNLKVVISLTCSNCPATVMSACQIASWNDQINVEIFDIVHYPKLRFKYQITSVPLLIIDDKKVISGKMNLEEMLTKLEKLNQ